MATAYHRDQPGAPIPVYGTGAPFEAFKKFLKAALVDGFGSQPAAGWLLVDEGANHLVLRNGSGTGYIGFSNTPAVFGEVTIRVSETFLGMSGSVMTGDGVKTGVAAGATVPHKLHIGFIVSKAAQGSWFIVADEKTFILQAYGTNSSDVVDGGAPFSISLYAGEDSLGGFIAVGGENTNNATINNKFNSSSFTTLKNPATGLLVGADSIAVITPSLTLGSEGRAAFTPVPFSKLHLSPVQWIGGGVFAGSLRGVALSPMLQLVNTTTAAACLGLPGLVQRNTNTPINLGDGYTYFLASNQPYTALRFVTDNPEFW